MGLSGGLRSCRDFTMSAECFMWTALILPSSSSSASLLLPPEPLASMRHTCRHIPLSSGMHAGNKTCGLGEWKEKRLQASASSNMLQSTAFSQLHLASEVQSSVIIAHVQALPSLLPNSAGASLGQQRRQCKNTSVRQH